MTSSELIKKIRTKTKWIILVTLAAATASLIYYLRTPFVYESTVTFFIDDDDDQGLKFNENEQNNLILAKVSNGSRLYHLSKSSEMVDHLIKKFDLYHYYNIDSNSFSHYEKVNAVLQRNIFVIRKEYNSLAVTVKDLDKIVAANVANEIVVKLETMNRDFIISNIERKIKIYDKLIGNIKQESLEQTNELRMLINECKLLILQNNSVKNAPRTMAELMDCISTAECRCVGRRQN
jgi:hypothetical protein